MQGKPVQKAVQTVEISDFQRKVPRGDGGAETAGHGMCRSVGVLRH
jgi:hypothetical protein